MAQPAHRIHHRRHAAQLAAARALAVEAGCVRKHIAAAEAGADRRPSRIVDRVLALSFAGRAWRHKRCPCRAVAGPPHPRQ